MKRWKAVLAPATIVAAGVVFSCTSLPDIAPSVCGNHVVDLATEDCDAVTIGGGEDATTASKGRCGAPGTAAQCRILCTTSADCDGGWGCGLDGVCREPTGKYTATAPLVEDADDVALADFDGDGIADILTWRSPPHPFERTPRAVGEAALNVHFGEAAGEIKQAFRFDISNAPPIVGFHPTVGHLTGDLTRSDVAVSVRGGTAIFRGQADRTLLPILNPSFAVPDVGLRPLILDATKSSPGDEIFLFAQNDPLFPGSAIIPFGKNTLDVERRLALFPHSPRTAKVASIFTGRMHAVGGPRCDEIAVAFEGDDHVTIVTPCNGDTLNTCTPSKQAGCALAVPTRRIELPAGRSIAPDGMIFGDLDGDGDLDVVIASADRLDDGTFQEPVACVAFGSDPATGPDGVAHFKGAVTNLPGVCTDLPRFFRVKSNVSRVDPALLAFGQLTNDTVPDFVTESAVWLDVPRATSGADAGLDASAELPVDPTAFLHPPVSAPPGVLWTEAHILDINGDGKDDVVAGSASGVDVYLATGDPLLVHKSYPTAGPADLFTFSDFDGDGTRDIAFRQRGTAHGAARDPDGVAILFGHAGALPADPTALGLLGGIDQLVSGRTGQGLFATEPDGLGDLGIASQVGAGQQLTVLSGEVDRRIVSSFQLDLLASPAPLANRFAIGRFTADRTLADPHDDLAILSNAFEGPPLAENDVIRKTTSKYAVWLAPVLGEGTLDQARFGQAPPVPLGGMKSTNRLRADDLAATGDAFWPFASLLAIDLDAHASDRTTEGDELLVLVQGLGAAPWQLRTLGSTGGAAPVFRVDDARNVGLAPTQPTPVFRMIATDLNSNTKDPAQDADDVVLLLREGDKTTLQVLFNRRAHKLDAAVAIALPPGHEFVDVAAIHAGSGATHELALLASDGVFMARVQTPSGAIVVDSAPTLGFNGARRIAVGDVTGDRIEDIVVVGDKGIQVFRGEARLK